MRVPSALMEASDTPPVCVTCVIAPLVLSYQTRSALPLLLGGKYRKATLPLSLTEGLNETPAWLVIGVLTPRRLSNLSMFVSEDVTRTKTVYLPFALSEGNS